jgi:hypothetical protein
MGVWRLGNETLHIGRREVRGVEVTRHVCLEYSPVGSGVAVTVDTFSNGLVDAEWRLVTRESIGKHQSGHPVRVSQDEILKQRAPHGVTDHHRAGQAHGVQKPRQIGDQVSKVVALLRLAGVAEAAQINWLGGRRFRWPRRGSPLLVNREDQLMAQIQARSDARFAEEEVRTDRLFTEQQAHAKQAEVRMDAKLDQLRALLISGSLKPGR